MRKARSAKIDSLSTADWQQFHRLLSSRELMAQFADEAMRFSRTPLKPDEVLRRFSLNGDGQLDLREFQLAAKRLELVGGPETSPAALEARARALYLAFCPSAARKLDIDIFCRIMTEWSLQLMRSLFEQQTLDPQPAAAARAPPNAIATPYATESQPATPSSRRCAAASQSEPMAGSPSTPSRTSDRGRSLEGEAVWRRISGPVAQHSDKLRQLFLRLDVSCSGCVSPDELEAALRHIGVFLTPRELDQLYESLDDQVKAVRSSGGASTFAIRYTELLAALQRLAQPTSRGFPSTSKQTSPPVVTVASARLWDALVAALDKLRPLRQQLQRIQRHALPPEAFRDCLRQCGMVLSNADFAALRVRLLPYSDSATGAIALDPLMAALESADRSSSQSRTTSTPPYLPPNRPYARADANARDSKAPSAAAAALGMSPIRTGRKTHFSPPGVDSLLTAQPQAAGKSNEQRNAEAERTMVRIRDESRWRSDLNFPAPSDGESEQQRRREQFQQHQQRQQDPFFSVGGRPAPALEARVLAKMRQARELGQLGGACSPQTIFPGDRFGRITRGQFRQGLAHLGVLARYAEVEALFWTLDPAGRGYIVARDLYSHLSSSRESASLGAGGSDDAWKHLRPSISTDEAPESSQRLTRSVQKVLERMLLDFPQLYAICERGDVRKTGTVSPPALLSAIQELGILASVADTQTAIAALCPPMDMDPASRSAPAAADMAIPYRNLDARLAQLCSELLSPKKRRKMHLSTASVLLAPHEQLYSERLGSAKDGGLDMNTVSETDALWNCPRRRMHQAHRANKTSIYIGDSAPTDPQTSLSSHSKSLRLDGGAAGDETLSREERRRLLAIVAIIHDLLERRSDLKSVMDMHRRADTHGQVSKKDLVDMLMTSRLSLDLTRGVSAAAFVDALYPSPPPSSRLRSDANTHVSVGYLDLLHRCNDLLAESIRALQTSRAVAATPSKLQQHRQTARRLDSTVTFGSSSSGAATDAGGALPAMYSTSLLQPQQERERKDTTTYGTGSLATESDAMESVRRKLLVESRLRGLFGTVEGQQSAAVLVRHAFKGLAPREMVVPVDNGEFEAMCRASDLKHVCYRLGLDLDTREQQLVAQVIDANGSGFVSSPQVLQFLMHLAKGAEKAPSTTGEPSDDSATRVRWFDCDSNSMISGEEEAVAATEGGNGRRGYPCR